MSTVVQTTSRATLRAAVGVNTHFNKTGYQHREDGSYDRDIMAALLELKPGFIREAWWPGNRSQREAFAVLVRNGIDLHLTLNNDVALGDVDTYVQACVDAGLDRHVVHWAGLNEPNDDHRPGWVAKTLQYQRALFDAVTSRQRAGHFARCKVAGPSLKHQVSDLDADYRAISGVRQLCHVGNFHFYPAWDSAAECPAELERARQAFGTEMDLLQTESGRTREDTPQHHVGEYLVDWTIRMFHEQGCLGSVAYEFADEDDLPGREGQFGMFSRSTGPWAAYHALQPLLARPDGGERSPVSISNETDADALVLSNGSGSFDVYLSWPPADGHERPHAELVLSRGFTCEKGASMAGPAQGGARFRVRRPSSGALYTLVNVSPSRT